MTKIHPFRIVLLAGLACLSSAGPAGAVDTEELLEKLKFTAVKEIEIVQDGAELLAQVVAEVTNGTDRTLVLRNGMFNVTISRNDNKFAPVKLDAAKPMDLTEIAPGGMARASKSNLTMICRLGPADSMTTREVLVRLFNMVGVQPRAIKITLDGKTDVGIKLGQSLPWREQTALTLFLEPQQVDQALIQ